MTRRRAGGLPAIPDTRPSRTEAVRQAVRHEVRLRMRPQTAPRSCVDGAWWPRSHEPAVEFPGLVLVMSSWAGPVTRVAYNLGEWDATTRDLIVEGWPVRLVGGSELEANTVAVTGPNHLLRLLVVPPDTPGGVARAVLRAASGLDSAASVAEILASNGILPDGSAATP